MFMEVWSMSLGIEEMQQKQADFCTSTVVD